MPCPRTQQANLPAYFHTIYIPTFEAFWSNSTRGLPSVAEIQECIFLGGRGLPKP